MDGGGLSEVYEANFNSNDAFHSCRDINTETHPSIPQNYTDTVNERTKKEKHYGKATELTQQQFDDFVEGKIGLVIANYENQICTSKCEVKGSYSNHFCSVENTHNYRCANFMKDQYGRECKADVNSYGFQSEAIYCYVQNPGNAHSGGSWGWTHPYVYYKGNKPTFCRYYFY